MSFRNEYAEWADVVYELTPEQIAELAKALAGDGNGGAGAGSSTPNTTMSGGLRVDSQNSRDKDIAALSESRIQVALRMGILTEGEVDRVKGAGYTARLADNPWGSAENKIMAEWQANPPAFYRSTLDSSESPTQALKGLSTVSGEPYGNGPQVNGAGGYTGPGTSPISAGGGASRTAGSSGGGGASVAAPPPEPPPAYNSATDLGNRGAIPSGRSGVALLNGQQYRNPGSPIKGEDNLWYNVGPDGQPSGAGFKSETAANYAKAYVDYGPGMTSRLGNSPTAKGAMQGGYSQQVENPLFNTFSMDQSIAAGAQKGIQGGDILGTMNRAGYQPLDITYGGTSEQGGLTPVGNPADPFSSFTGQIAGNTSIGMSSILGNSGHDTQHWLSQMSGIPPSEIAKLRIDTPEKAIQFEQAVSTARQMGTMPNFASLYALNEPAAPGGAYGGSDLKWGSANGGANNTEYDRQLAGFANYALGSPDLTYLPEPSGMGSTQVGNVAYGSNMLIDPNYYYGG